MQEDSGTLESSARQYQRDDFDFEEDGVPVQGDGFMDTGPEAFEDEPSVNRFADENTIEEGDEDGGVTRGMSDGRTG